MKQDLSDNINYYHEEYIHMNLNNTKLTKYYSNNYRNARLLQKKYNPVYYYHNIKINNKSKSYLNKFINQLKEIITCKIC